MRGKKMIENTNEIYKELLKWDKKKCSNFFTNKITEKSDDKVNLLCFHLNYNIKLMINISVSALNARFLF